MHDFFRIFSSRISNFIGSLWALLTLVLALGLTGYLFNFSDRWESGINFILSVVTLTVLIFLQKSQNHNDKATHLKLDELIKASEGARNEVAAVEDEAEENMDNLKERDQ
jgi:low affinity Fe/Cu permease